MIYRRMLITGCGGDIGLALGRIAREAALSDFIVGCDIHADHPGAAFYDSCEVVPPAASAEYLDVLTKIVQRHQIEVVVPTSEAELSRLLHDVPLQIFAGVTLLRANSLAVEIGLDKYATYQTLNANGLGVPWTRLCSDGPPPEIPCIIKPRRGQGSKGVVVVDTPELASLLGSGQSEQIWQERLVPPNEEYTCCVFRAGSGEVRSIALRRRLRGGLTASGEVVDAPTLTQLLTRVADVLQLRGSINVQLIWTQGGPKVFEINPRFSSTVKFRHDLGFRDFEWSLLDCKGVPLGPFKLPAAGTRFYRASSEIILPPGN